MKRFTMLVSIALATTACAHQQPEATPPPQAAPQPTSQNDNKAIDASSPLACASDNDCKDTQICSTDHCVEVSAAVQECSTSRVHFPFNSAQLPDSERASLQRAARCLRADHALHITVEGNADERGTEEYNLALGDQRATAVAKYLAALGASKAQLKTVSYGKDQPLCTEHDEECWAKNRRAGLQVGEAGAKEKH